MSDPKNYEDIGRKGKRLTNNHYLYARSFDNRKDIPIVKVNTDDKVEFKQIPYVKGLGFLKIDGPTSGQYFFNDTKIITSDNINSKSLDLSHAPINPQAVFFIPVGGPEQHYEIDFIIEGSTLKWDGRGLDGLLEVNDRVSIFYQM